MNTATHPDNQDHRVRVRRRTRDGLTISEVLVVTLVIALLLAALLPVARRVSLDSGQAVSAANLQKIALAHASYSADWNDRQVTWCPDDLGLIGGSFQSYAGVLSCPPSLLLGFGESGSMWGYLIPCQFSSGSWGNSTASIPNTFTFANVFGSFRMTGARAFAAYIDGRHYSPLLYAPNDTITIQRAAPYIDLPVEFTVLPAPFDYIVHSSYAFSPAAMWDPRVLSKNPDTGAWFSNPNTVPIGFRSPTASTCLHPALKTRTIEHNWNLGQPAPVNPAFAGNFTPYFFSQGIDAAPITLFFDGRVAELPNTQVAADDATVLASTGGEVGLWTRDTPLGVAGYYGNQSWDTFVTGHHILTAGGILGRDVLSAEPAPGGVAEFSESRRRAALRRAAEGRNASGTSPRTTINAPGHGFMPEKDPSW